MSYKTILFQRKGSNFLRPTLARVQPNADHTLFLPDPPHGCDATQLADALRACAAVSEARDATEPTSGSRVAYLTFASADDARRVLASDRTFNLPRISSCKQAAAADESVDELQASVSDFMLRFEKSESERLQHADEQHNQMDEDGFIMVTRKRKGRQTATEGATGATMSATSAAAAAARAAKRARKKKNEVHLDLYQFHAHERKREKLEKLREQFEVDKARIAKLRLSRRSLS